EQAFEGRERNPRAERAMRRRLVDRPAAVPQTLLHRRENNYANIRAAPGIGVLTSDFLSESLNKLNLAGVVAAPDGFLVNPSGLSQVCLPTGGVFRTAPEPGTGCGP
ncbi:unnamed protein product, partial [Scytosiphon promiscuus]